MKKANIEEPLKSVSPYKTFVIKYLYGYGYKHNYRRKEKKYVKSSNGNSRN